jgi:hypothetical protein
MNGKPGDDPALDILHHRLEVYTPEIDRMVRELGKLMDFRRLQDLLFSLTGRPVAQIESLLSQKLEALRKEAQGRGWESP